jgi:integrase
MPTGGIDDKGKPVFRRVQRSTGTDDKTKALQLAISYERAAIAAAEKRWGENSARRFLAEVEAIVGVSTGATVQADDYLRRWLGGRERSLKPASFARYAGIVDEFLSFLGPRARGQLGEITGARVVEFRDAQTAAGKSARTVNKSLMVLAQAFAEAHTTGLVPVNPARGINVKGEKRTAQKRRAFTFEQFRELVRVTAPDYVRPGAGGRGKNFTLPPDWQTLVMVCGYTGARQQEAAQLSWAQVDLTRRRIMLERAKNGDEHWIPLHASLAAHLARTPEPERRGKVMPHIAAMQRRHVSNEFRRGILPRAGIVQEFASGEGRGLGRRLAEYSLHSLRHSLSSWLAAAGVGEDWRMRLIGHEDEAVNRGYTHTELDQAAAELAKVPSV